VINRSYDMSQIFFGTRSRRADRRDAPAAHDAGRNDLDAHREL